MNKLFFLSCLLVGNFAFAGNFDVGANYQVTEDNFDGRFSVMSFLQLTKVQLLDDRQTVQVTLSMYFTQGDMLDANSILPKRSDLVLNLHKDSDLSAVQGLEKVR